MNGGEIPHWKEKPMSKFDKLLDLSYNFVKKEKRDPLDFFIMGVKFYNNINIDKLMALGEFVFGDDNKPKKKQKDSKNS